MKENWEIITSIAALFVAFASLGVSIWAWNRPLPADPTAIPTLGSANDPFELKDDACGRAFFEFLDSNDGRKIRIIAEVDDGFARIYEDPDNPAMGLALAIPATGSLEGVERDVLNFRPTPEGLRGLSRQYSWELSGYFANEGLVSVKENDALRLVTWIDAVTAVS